MAGVPESPPEPPSPNLGKQSRDSWELEEKGAGSAQGAGAARASRNWRASERESERVRFCLCVCVSQPVFLFLFSFISSPLPRAARRSVVGPAQGHYCQSVASHSLINMYAPAMHRHRPVEQS